MVPTTLAVAMVLFGLYQAAPGDPATVMMGIGGGGEMGQDADVEAKIAKFRRKHGLDRHWAVQFLNYIGPFNLLRDGHPFFTSPFDERATEAVTLDDGSELVLGKPQAIAPLTDTTSAEVRGVDQLRPVAPEIAAKLQFAWREFTLETCKERHPITR